MKNWKKVKLGTLLTESKVFSETPNTDNRIRVKLNVLGIEKRPITKDKKGATKYYIRKTGQFIYGKQNLHKGAFGIIPEELDGFESSLDIPAFDVDDSCYPEWIFYFFKKGNFYLKLESLAKGVGSKRIKTEKIYGLEIYLPSKEEQRKILDEIEKVEINNNELIKELQFQVQNLKKLRQSILNDAIKGKLTGEWRKQNLNTEPAIDLLKKIKRDKEQLIKENEIKVEKNLSVISKDQIPFEIPKCWKWERIGNIKNPRKSISYGVLIPGQDVSNGIPLIRVSDLELAGTGRLPDKFISNEINIKFKKTIIEGDEILITVVGSTIGKTVISDPKWKGANIARAIARLKVHDLLENKYIYFVILSPYIQSSFTNSSRTIGQPTLNIRFIENTVVPIPPHEEQKVIIEKVSQFLLNCDKMEQEINSVKKNSNKLIQSVLTKLLGDENNKIANNISVELKKTTSSRKIKYNSKTTNMDLIKLLKENGKLHAEDLWMMSEHYDDKNISNSIDKFYADLKEKIEDDKTIKEVINEKGYIELV
jgi:restriction endonuclease S subunit